MKHVLSTLGGWLAWAALSAQTGAALDYAKISQTSGNLNADLVNHGRFGYVSADGQNRICAGAPFAGNGEVRLIELNPEGTVASEMQLHADDFPVFDTITGAEFGTSAAFPGDLNGDGKEDFLIGAPGAGAAGALVLLLSEGPGYTAQFLTLPENLSAPGLRLGAHLCFKSGLFYAALATETGSIAAFTVTPEGAVHVAHTYGPETVLLSEELSPGDRFGAGITVSDLDGDGIDDILCGAPGDDDGGTDYGAVYQVFLTAEGEADRIVKLSAERGGFTGFLNSGDDFGISTAVLGDLDQDGNVTIAVGAPGDDDGLLNSGAVWVIFLKADGTMKRQRKISLLQGNFQHSGLGFDDGFGTRIAAVGDLNGDGTVDLVSGTPGDDDGGTDRGAFFSVLIEQCEIPVAVFTYETDGPEVSFSIPGGEGFTYIWNFTGGHYSQEQNPVHTFSSTGTFTVCLTINGPCGGNHYCGPVSVTALSTASAEAEQTKVFPNPATTYFRIESPAEIRSVTLVDMSGREVYRDVVRNRTPEISVAGFAPGLYLLNIETAAGMTVQKIKVH